MNLLHRFFSATVSALITISFGICLSALATDYTDYDNVPNTIRTTWVSGNNYCRKKTNSSGIYLKNNSSQSSRVHIYGRNTQTGSDYNIINNNEITTTEILLPAYSERIIYCSSYIPYNYIHIFFESNNSFGEWSPDSLGYYPSLN